MQDHAGRFLYYLVSDFRMLSYKQRSRCCRAANNGPEKRGVPVSFCFFQFFGIAFFLFFTGSIHLLSPLRLFISSTICRIGESIN